MNLPMIILLYATKDGVVWEPKHIRPDFQTLLNWVKYLDGRKE